MNQHTSSPEICSFLDGINNSLVHYSLEYLDGLRHALDKTTIHILESRNGGNLKGYMPVAIFEHPTYGVVLNSLPFFGSHGGPICAGDKSIQLDLIQQFEVLIHELKATSATLIENLFEPLHETVISYSMLDVVDDRIGQITALPNIANNLETDLFSIIHSKTRNAVRKGQKLNLIFEDRNDDQSWEWMQQIHQNSILKLGGIPNAYCIVIINNILK